MDPKQAKRKAKAPKTDKEITLAVDDWFKRRVEEETAPPTEPVITGLPNGLYQITVPGSVNEIREFRSLFTSVRTAEVAIKGYKQRCLEHRR